MGVPAEFGPEFLDWFRQRTEAYWANHEPRAFEDYVRGGVGDADWQQGTRWLDGLPEEAIRVVEREWSLAFPPDYRLFLQRLHCVDRPMVGAYFTGEDGRKLEPAYKPSFCNWLTDKDTIQQKFKWILEGLEFDVEHNDLWLESWGEKPESLNAQKDSLRSAVSQAPKLVPILSHRYLVAEPPLPGNPVLSVYQSDIIVYGDDLRSYLLNEFAPILGLPTWKGELNRERIQTYLAIPFWGELLADNGLDNE